MKTYSFPSYPLIKVGCTFPDIESGCSYSFFRIPEDMMSAICHPGMESVVLINQSGKRAFWIYLGTQAKDIWQSEPLEDTGWPGSRSSLERGSLLEWWKVKVTRMARVIRVGGVQLAAGLSYGGPGNQRYTLEKLSTKPTFILQHLDIWSASSFD